MDGLMGNVVTSPQQWLVMDNLCNGQLDNGQLALWTVQRLGYEQHDGKAMEINGAMSMQRGLMEQKMENWHNGQLGGGQLMQMDVLTGNATAMNGSTATQLPWRWTTCLMNVPAMDGCLYNRQLSNGLKWMVSKAT